jgi:hypothetical protein
MLYGTDLQVFMGDEVGKVWKKLNELQSIASNENGVNLCEASCINHTCLGFMLEPPKHRFMIVTQ